MTSQSASDMMMREPYVSWESHEAEMLATLDVVNKGASELSVSKEVDPVTQEFIAWRMHWPRSARDRLVYMDDRLADRVQPRRRSTIPGVPAGRGPAGLGSRWTFDSKFELQAGARRVQVESDPL